MRRFSSLLVLAAVALGGCDDTLSFRDIAIDPRNFAHVRFINAYREDLPNVVQLFVQNSLSPTPVPAGPNGEVEVGQGKSFSEVQGCVHTSGTLISAVADGEQTLVFRNQGGNKDEIARITYTFDASKEYLIVLMDDPAASPRAPKAVIYEESFAGVPNAPADSFAIRVINAGATAGTVLFSQPGSGSGFTAGPALVAANAPVALNGPTFVPTMITLAPGESTDGFLRFFIDIPARVGPPVLEAVPGPRRLRFFTDGILTTTSGGTVSAVSPRSNIAVGTGSFTATNGRMATVILTDRPTTGTISGVVAPRCVKLG